GDYVGCFVVTTGEEIADFARSFEAKQDDYSAIMVKALADRLAEAYAEYLHERIRKEYWGYQADENLTNDELIQEKYKGIRQAPEIGRASCRKSVEVAGGRGIRHMTREK